MDSDDSTLTDDEEMEIIDECYLQFSKAIVEKNNNLINSLISKDGNVGKKFNRDETTFLHVAAKFGTIENIHQLCKKGANVNMPNKYGETPIFYAVKNSTEMVKTLINYGAKLNITSEKADTPLHNALLRGTEETVQIIFDELVSKTDKNSKDNSKNSNKDNNKYNSKDSNKDTNKDNSKDDNKDNSKNANNSNDKNCNDSKKCFSTTVELIENLLKNKKRLNLQKNDYPLLIFFAAKFKCNVILNLVLKDCRNFLKSMTKAEKERERNGPRKAKSIYFDEGGCNVRYRIHQPEELNFQGYFDRTALHYAVREQLPDVVYFLLANGADVDCKTCDKLTPLHYAACLENIEMCHLLLDFDALVNSNRCCQGNPLYHVCGKSEARVLLTSTEGYYYDEFHDEYQDYFKKSHNVEPTFNMEIMKLLLNNGAKTGNKGSNGKSAVHEACAAGRLKELKLLVKYGAYLEDDDMDGNFLLHNAAKGNNVKLIDFLLENGLKIDVKNSIGETPLMLAVKEENIQLEIIEYLVDRGANVNQVTERTSVLLTAVNEGSIDVVECLLELGANFSKIYDVEEGNVYSYKLRFLDTRKLLVALIALKGNDLNDYIQSFVKRDDENVREAFDYFERMKSEVAKMKTTILKQMDVSYYDFLTQNFYTIVELVKNPKVRKIFNSCVYKKEFPSYCLFMENRFKRAKILKNFVDKTFVFLTKKYNKLPTEALKMIMRNFTSKDFRVFGKVLTKKRF